MLLRRAVTDLSVTPHCVAHAKGYVEARRESPDTLTLLSGGWMLELNKAMASLHPGLTLNRAIYFSSQSACRAWNRALKYSSVARFN
jgi:hypothetical protein